MIGVPGATLVIRTANPVTAVAQGVQMRTPVSDPVTARRTLKEATAVVAKWVSSICRKLIQKVVKSVSVQGFQTDVRAPTGPTATYKI